MAKRDPRHPALRGYQVWRWLGKSILKAKPLFGTQILVVQEAVRVRLNAKYRTTLSQGIFLVPRWIQAPEYELEKFLKLSQEELREKGIVWVSEKDGYYLLIFQQVEDMDHLVRQQDHILFDEVHTRAFDLQIRPYILVRKTAARELREVRQRQLTMRRRQIERLREGKLRPPIKLLKDPKKMTPKVIQGVVNHLKKVVSELDEIIERPLVVRRKRAQRSIRSAIRWIGERNFYLARRRLEKALENLIWPEEE
ncbi:hypothetical protein GTO10_02160 [Candidatus Saccharibacteria bacterium]|nr:hypothetical protein [Candidatus Saccharibacteria bacterium]